MPVKAIVIVEDDTSIAELMKTALSMESDYAVTTVGNGADALELTAQVQTDLIILDYRLPGMNGIEVYHQLRKRLGDAMPPVLFMSANMPEHELVALKQAVFLQKPFELETLIDQVATLLAEG